MSVPGVKLMCKFAMRDVGVRRGSSTITFVTGFALWRFTMRSKSMGCASAVFEPMMKNTSAWSMSS